MKRQLDVRRGIPLALCAGTLLGAGSPLSKVLVSRMDPVVLAGVLYTGPALLAALAQLLESVSNGAVLVVERDDQRRSLVWETAEQ
jgi:drug/metabolite transporter (DMT)-like permease